MAIGMGDVLAGKYRILRLLGQGGMGSVYHGIQEPLNRDVAIKTLLTESLTPQERTYRETRFFREAAICSQLQHPHTVIVYDYGELPDGELFLVMEYLEGQSLRQLQKQRHRLEPALAIHIASQIAASLADAHAHGVIHRDLKPPNIMLVTRGSNPHFVKVVDFGLVKDLSRQGDEPELTRDDAIMGSPMYMAPERFLSKEFDAPAVDIYALGVMLYEMLCGRPPFELGAGSTIHQLVLDHVETPPPSFEEVAPGLVLPAGLATLVMACLEKVPRNRPASMDVVYQHLAQISSTVKAAESSASMRRPGLERAQGVVDGLRSSPTPDVAQDISQGMFAQVAPTMASDIAEPEHVDSSAGSAPQDDQTPDSGMVWAISGIVLLVLVAALVTYFYAKRQDVPTVDMVVPKDAEVAANESPCGDELTRLCAGKDASCLSANYESLSPACQAITPRPALAPTIGEWLSAARAARVDVLCRLGETIEAPGARFGQLDVIDRGILTVKQDTILGETSFRCLAIGKTEVRGPAGIFSFVVAAEEPITVDLAGCPAGAPVAGRALFGQSGEVSQIVMFSSGARARCAEERMQRMTVAPAKSERIGAFSEN